MFELEQERYELREEPAYDFVPSRRDFLATLGGGLMVLGHLVFAAHFIALALGMGPQRDQPALLRQWFGKKVAA